MDTDVEKLLFVLTVVIMFVLGISLVTWSESKDVCRWETKIRLKYKTFRDYYMLNPDAYILRDTPVRKVTKDGKDVIYKIVFGYIDYYRFVIFRTRIRHGMIMKFNADVTEQFLTVVQGDINHIRECARTEIEKAKKINDSIPISK